MKNKTFTLTEDHLKLLKRAFVRWEDCETGAPAIDCKRPYGNSFVEGDVAELLGWKYNDNDEMSSEMQNKALKIHAETETALQIILATQSFKTGIYIRADEYDSTSWKLSENIEV